MSFKNSLRDRAIAAFYKVHPNAVHDIAIKRRSDKTIWVRGFEPTPMGLAECIIERSYKNGGKLEKIA